MEGQPPHRFQLLPAVLHARRPAATGLPILQFVGQPGAVGGDHRLAVRQEGPVLEFEGAVALGGQPPGVVHPAAEVAGGQTLVDIGPIDRRDGLEIEAHTAHPSGTPPARARAGSRRRAKEKFSSNSDRWGL